MGVLRDRMIEEMKLRNFSTATQQSYVYAVSRLARYHNKSPDQLSKEDIRAFLVHLTVERKLSPNSLTGYCSGLRFFYNETLGWDETKLFIPPRKKPSLLPEVFSPEEVVRLIGAARGLKQRVLLMTAYAAGLRVSELVNLKITDIDAARIAFKLLIKVLRKKPWIVYAKKSFGSPTHVLDYLGRYTHRVALSNDRILSAHNGEVTF